MIRTEVELDELLSRPCDADVAALRALGGDLLILGAGGKIGPTLALRARRAMPADRRVIAVARFSKPGVADQFRAGGIEVIASDLLEPGALASLPDVPNVIFMAAMKFGTTGAAHQTWAMNTYLPGLVVERYARSRIVAFSTGNVYPLMPVAGGGASESTAVAPVGEYAQSALGRERMFEYGSMKNGTPAVLLRLNYAIDLRYGVLVDIASKVLEGRPVNLTMGFVNVVWQGDANSMCLRSFAHCQSPPLVLNITGPETVAVRTIALEFGKRLGREPVFEGAEADTALLNNSRRSIELFGKPEVSLDQMIEWVSDWIREGGSTLGKPTHFEARDGRF